MKQRLFKLAMFLILGAVVNVAVAWGCAKWIMLDNQAGSTVSSKGYLNGEDFDVVLMQLKGAMLIKSKLTLDWPSVATKSAAGKLTSEISARFRFVHPSHDNLQEMSGLVRILTAYGWPRLCLWSGYEKRRPDESGRLNLPSNWTIRSGLRITGEQSIRNTAKAIPRTIPYRPIWPGFAINTLLYAAILWILALIPFTARRVIRYKRGRCIKCGYDLRGSTSGGGCPECGWGREAEA